MNRKNTQMRLAALAATLTTLFLFIGGVAANAGVTDLLGDYFESSSQVLPDKLNLSLFVEGGYKDNIHSAVKGNEKGSAYLKQGLTLDILNTSHAIKYGVMGKFSFDYYAKDSSDMNELTWSFVPHLMLSDKGYKIGPGILRMVFSSTHTREQLDTADTRYAKKTISTVGATYDIQRGNRWGVIFSTNYTNTYHEESEFKDRNKYDWQFGVSPYYNISPKLKVGLTYAYGITRYENNRTSDDSDSHTINVFTDYRMSKQLGFYLSAGAIKKDYDGLSENTNENNDWRPDLTFALRAYPTENIMLEWREKVTSEDSNGRGLKETIDNSIGGAFRLTAKLSCDMRLGYKISDEKTYESDLGEIYFNGNITYLFNEHFSAKLGYSINDIKYKTLDKQDYQKSEVFLRLNYTL